MNWEQFLYWEKASKDTIDVKRMYIDIAGDLVTGVLLSQIIYWHLPDEEGNSKLTVFKNGHWWIAKSRSEWWDECRISVKQADRGITKLAYIGVIEKETFKYKGSPTTHIRINPEKFMERVNSILPKGQFPSSPKGNMEITQRGISSISKRVRTESTPPVPYEKIKDLYHDLCPSLPKVITLSENRKKHIQARFRQYGNDLEVFRTLFKAAGESDFLNGKNDRKWTANFDWLMGETNMAKVLEGRYENKEREPELLSPVHRRYEG